MAEFSKIAWCDGTFNPWIGCTRVSPGCENCYAENLMANRYQRVKWGPGNPRSRTKTWNDPVRWNREAERTGVRKRVFCASLADFLDGEVPAQWREDLFDLIERCTSIDWLMLTKRIGNYSTMVPPAWLDNPLKHVWLGVTAENQKYWDNRIPVLESMPAAIHWVSYEPALGPLDISNAKDIDWIIAGGESAQTMDARRFDVEWSESLIEQCRKKGVVPFIKQKGANAYYRGKRLHCVDKAGTDPSEWPAAVRVREFPASPAA